MQKYGVAVLVWFVQWENTRFDHRKTIYLKDRPGNYYIGNLARGRVASLLLMRTRSKFLQQPARTARTAVLSLITTSNGRRVVFLWHVKLQICMTLILSDAARMPYPSASPNQRPSNPCSSARCCATGCPLPHPCGIPSCPPTLTHSIRRSMHVINDRMQRERYVSASLS